ncbi:hypothetical protein CEXT_504821 [Caerostris extrusa]|uniref:Uncharacterized protein n=1 Tax=Caerostris extrusa TaxID=172846 RepID=A0AAV4TWA4_CAEEX|nr:hypothetical protein CEXT_504821 [Caerostris extrusa]
MLPTANLKKAEDVTNPLKPSSATTYSTAPFHPMTWINAFPKCLTEIEKDLIRFPNSNLQFRSNNFLPLPSARFTIAVYSSLAIKSNAPRWLNGFSSIPAIDESMSRQVCSNQLPTSDKGESQGSFYLLGRWSLFKRANLTFHSFYRDTQKRSSSLGFSCR